HITQSCRVLVVFATVWFFSPTRQSRVLLVSLLSMTTATLLSTGACKLLIPRPGIEDVELILQVSATISVVGIPPFQHCLALFDGIHTIPAMLSADLSVQLDPIGSLQKILVGLERVSWWENPRNDSQMMVIEAMHIIEDREDFIILAA
ncbi:hypothetical protein DFH07DRAFT_425730, partial [Mycena maculata]